MDRKPILLGALAIMIAIYAINSIYLKIFAVEVFSSAFVIILALFTLPSFMFDDKGMSG